MCEQTEINYMDGDVVWVKLGPCWWPGQVINFDKLPADIQTKIKKKPLIATVKFFHEDTYEFVKNIHQIYKYNCTQKDDFIKKGLDKYRTKSKDGSKYMDKFPEDVEMAEKLTGGDPAILSSSKFSPEQKPDIAALFGEKKVPKKKREDNHRRTISNIETVRKITHPRFLRESDHEVRIRQQPSSSSLQSTPNAGETQIYACPICNFTSSRVNVTIWHNKSHRSGGWESPSGHRPLTSPAKSRLSLGNSQTPKRKYVRKNKSLSSTKTSTESVKRKYTKHIEKVAKKKKSDPELREKLLADWDDGSEDDNMDVDLNKSTDSVNSTVVKETSQKSPSPEEKSDEKQDNDGLDILKASEKLLKDTEKLSDELNDKISNNKLETDENETKNRAPIIGKSKLTSLKKKTISNSSDEARRNSNADNEDKKSKLSCFDFDDEDPEPAIPPVRKIPRVFGEKNTSLKKEIIKKFTLSQQALENEKDHEKDSEKILEKSQEEHKIVEETVEVDDEKLSNEINQTVNEASDLVAKIASETESANIGKSKSEATETELEIVEIFQVEQEKDDEQEVTKDNDQKLVEDLEQEAVKDDDQEIMKSDEQEPMKEDEQEKMNDDENKAVKDDEQQLVKNDEQEAVKNDNQEAVKDDEQVAVKDNEPGPVTENEEKIPKSPVKSVDDHEKKVQDDEKPSSKPEEKQIVMMNSPEIDAGRVTIEEEDDTLPISQLTHSASGSNELTDVSLTQMGWSQLSEIIGGVTPAPSNDQEKSQPTPELDKPTPRRRGRPRKIQTNVVDNGDNSLKLEETFPGTPDSQDTDRKTSESDTDRSYTGRRRKPNKKYLQDSDIYSPGRRTDDSQSETEEKPLKEHKRGKRGRKPSGSNKSRAETLRKSLEEYEFSDHTLDSAEESASFTIPRLKSPTKSIDSKKSDVMSPVHITDLLASSDVEIRGSQSSDTKEETTHDEIDKVIIDDKLPEINDTLEDVEEMKIDETKKPESPAKLPPKKSQIKKFELSQIDLHEGNSSTDDKITTEIVPETVESKAEGMEIDFEMDSKPIAQSVESKEIENVVTDIQVDETTVAVDSKETIVEETIENIIVEEVIEESKEPEHQIEAEVEEKLDEKPIEKPETDQHTPDIAQTYQEETIVKPDEVPETVEEQPVLPEQPSTQEIIENVEMPPTPPSQPETSIPLPVEETVEEVVCEKTMIVEEIIEQQSTETIAEVPQELQTAIEPTLEPIIEVQKHDDNELSNQSMSTSSPSSDVSVPVKKREKPRIIENVQLKEPMQILKSKLLEKQPMKVGKHKLEQDSVKKSLGQGGPKTKVMKIDPNNRGKSVKSSSQLSLTQKLQVLKAEEAAMEMRNEKIISTPPSTISIIGGEKLIQQPPQSLEDMDLDINSIPFVLSEDLNPDNIEQMPVMISSIIPSSSATITTALTLTTTSQLVSTEQQCTQTTSTATETITVEASPAKKKTNSPAILKNKGKAKPTITSIKTLNPPLTGGVKGLKFQNTQTSKATPVISQKGSPGKYVIVQTAGSQQVHYTVQGKSGMQQKMTIPAGKTAGNPQIVQQGGKVVILTSPQSGQSKMVPLSMPKSATGKSPKLVGSKGPIYNSNLISTKGSPMIAPKGDGTGATTSKLVSGQKMMNASGMMSPKGVLTQISGSKSGTVLNLPPGVFKDGVFTPMRTTIGGKTIIGQKTIVTNKGTFLSQITSGQSGTKTILAPISPASLSGKTLISTQGLVPGKGTVLTPITGQQVKAIAAKSPAKPGKIQYQAVQQKVQLPMLQKCQKIPISSASSTMRVSSSLKSPSGTIVFQNAQKTTPTGKKIVRQHTIVSHGRSPQSSSQQSLHISSPSPLQRSKTFTTTAVTQKVTVPRNRSAKAQQKIVVQKIHDSTATAPGLTPIKSSVSTSTSVTKSFGQSRSSALANRQPADHLLTKNIHQKPQSPIKSTNIAPVITEAEIQAPLEQIIEQTLSQSPKVEIPATEVVAEPQKLEEPKIPQPQIMALPTESSDGTQTYVLVTIDEQGQIQPLDNNTLMSLEGTTQNPDGTRTLYIDPSSLGEAGTLDNIVLQFDNGSLPNLQASTITDTNQTVAPESFPSNSEQPIIQTSSQDILAAALANSDFQQEIGLPEAPTSSVISTGLTQTSLINQTILQSTIIPTSEPISSPSVLETSLTLNQPIMTPLEVPSSLPIQQAHTTSQPISSTPSSLELPITITNPSISYISAAAATSGALQIPGNSMPDIGELMDAPGTVEIAQTELPVSTQYVAIPNLDDNISIQAQTGSNTSSYSVSIPESIILETSQVQTTPSMPIIDDSFAENVEYSTIQESETSEQSFVDVPVSEMLVTKTENVEEISQSQELTTEASVSSQDEIPTEELNIPQPSGSTREEETSRDMPIVVQEEEQPVESMDVEETNSVTISSCMPTVEESVVSAESNLETQSSIFEANPSDPSSEASDKLETVEKVPEIAIQESNNVVEQEEMEVEQVTNMETSPIDSVEKAESSSQVETASETMEIHFDDASTVETTQETPSQSFEESPEIPSQSATKSENSREPSQSTAYESMEIDDNIVSDEPPTQSFEDVKTNEASQSYDASESNTNAPTQSFNETMQEERTSSRSEEIIDDPSFPTQSYEVGKPENLSESIETDGELSQEGNIPSQSNDIGNDVIGTSSFNNTGLNEDETASSSYVPETPETQERDQDQESAISTSSYEIPTCEEINIASSSVNPDTSVGASEHSSIHDNGVPEIPTSSYNLNPDSSSSGHVDAVPSSSYEDQVIVEQNVSTSYEVPISMPGLGEENSSQNFVSESTDHANEPTSYYARHPEDVTSEASQSYFAPEGPSPSYTSQTASPSYYEPPPETEASQSFYSQDMERTEQSSSTNVEASQSFYQETSDEFRLRQQGEATPTYTERYPVDYTLENSPIERHDLVESSVPATRPTER